MPSSPIGGGGITPLCSAGGAARCSSLVPGGSFPCGMVFSTVSCVSPLEAERAVSGTKQKPRKISAAPVVQLTARAILVQSHLQYRFCWGFLLRWIECGESTPGVRRSELQRCPLGHIYDHRVDLTLMVGFRRFPGASKLTNIARQGFSGRSWLCAALWPRLSSTHCSHSPPIRAEL